MDLTSYSILLCISYLSTPLAPFSWASREGNHTALTFISIMWVLLVASPLVAILGLMSRGLYPASFLDPRGLSFNYFLVSIILLSLMTYFHLSRKNLNYSLSMIALSLANIGTGILPFIPGLVNSKEVIDTFGEGTVVLLYVLALVTVAASLADIAFSFKVYGEERKFLIMKRVTKALQKKGSMPYWKLRKEIGLQEPALSEALNKLLNRREIDVETRNGEDYFTFKKEDQN